MGYKENVRTLLAQRGWSQRELASAAGISPGAVGDILEGKSSNLRTATKVAGAFGVEVADLMREEQPMEPRDELDVALRHLGDLSRGDIQGPCTPSSPIPGARGRGGASVAARACLPPPLMVYAQRVREHFPRVVAGTTVADLDALAVHVCTSLDDFPLAHELSEFLLRRYLDALPDQCRRERVCDAFAAELLLQHAAVLASVAVLIRAHAGGPAPSDATLDQLAQRMASTYDVSLRAARISVAECLTKASWVPFHLSFPRRREFTLPFL